MISTLGGSSFLVECGKYGCCWSMWVVTGKERAVFLELAHFAWHKEYIEAEEFRIRNRGT